MCRGTTLRAWEASTLRELVAVDGVELAAVVIDATERGPRPRKPSTLLWDAFHNRWVARRSSALELVDCRDPLGTLPTLRCTVRREGFSEYFSAADLAAIGAFDLDVLVRFGFGIIRGEILDLPRYGVWSYHHGDEQRYRGSAPCFWELHHGEATVGAVLQRLTESLDAGVVLHRGTFPIVAHSYTSTRDGVLFGAAPWLARCARALAHGLLDLSASGSDTRAPLRRNPSNATMTAFLARQALRCVGHAAELLLRQPRWEVGTIPQAPAQLLTDTPGPVTWARPRILSSSYLADPFPLDTGALVECFDHRTGRGEIRRLARGPEGWRLSPWLDVEGHSSYPAMVEHQGVRYATPQISASPGVRLFADDGHGWKDHGQIVEGIDVRDPTLVRWEERWYLFATDRRFGANVSLRCWVADRIDGPWRSHLLNPVKSDVRSARPAGTPFIHDGSLFRPAQDCSRRYGGALVLNRVERLSDREFEESVVRVLGPLDDSHRAGFHTLASDGRVTWVDGCTKVFIPAAARREVVARLKARRS